MHGAHHIATTRPEIGPRVETRKPPGDKDGHVGYSRVSERSDNAQRHGARRGPPPRQRDKGAPPQNTSGLLGPQGPIKGRNDMMIIREPFRAVSSTAKLWAALVIADMESFDGLSRDASKPEPKEDTALNDLFARAVK